MGIDAFMSIENLMGFSGASTATSIVVTMLENLFGKYIPSQLLSLIVALVIMLCVCFFTGNAGGEEYFVAVINAFLVAAASNGIYDATSRALGGIKK